MMWSAELASGLRAPFEMTSEELEDWRKQRFWMVHAPADASLPPGWHWGEAWSEKRAGNRIRSRGRWAVRNRDGRHVRVAFSRYHFQPHIRPESLKLVLQVENTAREDPVRYARVILEMEDDMIRYLRNASARFDLREAVDADIDALNELARKLLDPPEDT